MGHVKELPSNIERRSWDSSSMVMMFTISKYIVVNKSLKLFGLDFFLCFFFFLKVEIRIWGGVWKIKNLQNNWSSFQKLHTQVFFLSP